MSVPQREYRVPKNNVNLGEGPETTKGLVTRIMLNLTIQRSRFITRKIIKSLNTPAGDPKYNHRMVGRT